jgi:hypothetical protein
MRANGLAPTRFVGIVCEPFTVVREDGIQFSGGALVRAFPTWNARSMFAHIRPVSRTATSPAG